MNIEEKREYNRKKVAEWRKKNPEKNKESRIKYKKSKNGKKSNAKYMKKYLEDEENMEKVRIRQYAYYHLRDELLDESNGCVICGGGDNLEIHHEEYDNSNLKKLKVMCRSCHKELHALN